MSTMSSLLIFLFYLSPLACTARFLGLADIGVSNTHLIIHGKVEKKVEVVKFDRSGSNKQQGDDAVAGTTDERSMEEKVERANNSNYYINGKSSSLVPNEKQTEKPVFLSDYAKPDTRPPSHN